MDVVVIASRYTRLHDMKFELYPCTFLIAFKFCMTDLVLISGSICTSLYSNVHHFIVVFDCCLILVIYSVVITAVCMLSIVIV